MSQQAGARRVTADLDAVDDSRCTVLHVDMDAFFAAVELLQRPELRGRPMMVAATGGRGVVLSATYEARAYGVRSAMPTAQALARCPGIITIPPDHRAYRAASRRLMDLLGEVTPLVEPVSVDEAFLDVSGSVRRLGRPAAIAARIRQRVADELGLTATVGASTTKFVAKLASSLAKPDGLLLVPPQEVEALLRPLPAGALWGIGPRTAAALTSSGYATVGEIRDSDPARLARILGQAVAQSAWRLAHGIDDRRVTPHSEEVSIGAERTSDTDLTSDTAIRRVLLELSRSAGARVRAADFAGRTVVLKIRFDDFTTMTRSESLPAAIADDRAIYAAALRCWERLASGQRPVRLLGVRLENLLRPAEQEEQLMLGAEPDRPGWRAAQSALDALADRFGNAAPKPATLVKPTRPS